ncbi:MULTISPECIES: hypothetical protein [unclassified Pseudomonas]|uniref:hypothetical protein n=1 Tax=unclassified Pseudomonas TaxID=196821 RepID=UPI000DA80354|nr:MULTISPECIES: hypothetical protein [unclassified Pseudomonas]MDW3715456.1 hypothetical protein [Pseudomonas sp. 2023EL-01195]PZE09477.1 hypothetical protein DMX10_30900 [Pseudomonas sp. 57B-090624]
MDTRDCASAHALIELLLLGCDGQERPSSPLLAGLLSARTPGARPASPRMGNALVSGGLMPRAYSRRD